MPFARLALAWVALLLSPIPALADEADQIIAEYQSECGIALKRSDLVSPPDARFNTSDYKGWIRNEGDLAGIFGRVLANYRGAVVLDANGVPLRLGGREVRIPMTATLRIASAWRNPKRNVRLGSKVGCTSRHLAGRALDLVPDPTAGDVEAAASTGLDTQKHLFPTLWNAAKLAGFAIAEVGALPVPCGTFEDHVHVHRR